MDAGCWWMMCSGICGFLRAPWRAPVAEVGRADASRATPVQHVAAHARHDIRTSNRPITITDIGMMRAFVLLVALLVLVVIVNSGATETTTVQHGHGRHSHKSTSLPWVAEAYTLTVRYDSTQHTLSYGSDEALGAMRHAPLLPDGTYGEVVRSMPLVCVDVLLQRADGRFLLLLRHAEPVKGLWWWPGGRLNFGESFADAALRKVKKEVGLHACFRQVLGTWNTLFERSAWSSPTQTVNILVHATIDDAAASRDDGEV